MSTTTLLTIEEIDRMIARGEFDGPNAKRVELIRGELREMSPIGQEHVDMVDWLTYWSGDVLDPRRFRYSIQNPIQIPALATMPHPDVVWRKVTRRMGGRPHAPNIVLLIEVADSSLAYDTSVKAQIYSEAGVRDYWVVDLPNRKLHLFRDPSTNGFQSHEVHAGDSLVAPVLVPGVSVTVNELFAVFEVDDQEDELS